MNYIEEYERFMDLYVNLQPNFNLHFWGKMCIITDLNGNQYRFPEIQTDILAFCTGKYKLRQIIDLVCNKYKATAKFEQIQLARKKVCIFIMKMEKKRFLIFDKNKTTKVTRKERFSGERGKFYPFYISVEITSRCNYNCHFCYKSSTKDGYDLSDNNLDKLLALKGKIKELRFLGGEPFLHPSFSEILKKVSNDFFISVVSNGSLLNSVDIKTLSYIDRLQISMYGYSEESYKDNTGSNNGWRNFKKSIEIANSIGINYKVCLTLGKEIINHLEEYIIAAIEAQAKEINFGMPSPVGRAVSNEQNKQQFIFDKTDIRFIYYKMRELKLKYKDKINIVVWQHSSLYRENEPMAFMECEGCLDCGGGWYSLVVSENGSIRPCELLPEDMFSYGGIDTIENIANSGNFYIKELRHMVEKYKIKLKKDNIDLKSICYALDKISF